MSEHPAGWYPDPRGRHEYRYWDGSVWTDHVADQGVSATDPVDVVGPARTEEPEPAAAETVERAPEPTMPAQQEPDNTPTPAEPSAAGSGLWSGERPAASSDEGTGATVAGNAISSDSGTSATPVEPAAASQPGAAAPGTTSPDPDDASVAARAASEPGGASTGPAASEPAGSSLDPAADPGAAALNEPASSGAAATDAPAPGAGSTDAPAGGHDGIGAGSGDASSTGAAATGAAAGVAATSASSEGPAASGTTPGAGGTGAAGGPPPPSSTGPAGPNAGDQAKAALKSATATKSPALAGLLTVAFPGAGHFYLGAGDKAPLAIGLLALTAAAYVVSWFSFTSFVIGFVIWAAAAAYGVFDLQGVLKPIREAGAAAASITPQQVGLVLVGGGILLIVGLILPWYHISVDISGPASAFAGGISDSGNAFAALEVLDFVLLIIGVVVVVLGATAMGLGPLTGSKLPPWLPAATAGVGVAALVIVAFRMLSVGADIPDAAGFSVDIGRGPGILLSGAAALAVAAAGLVSLVQSPRANTASRSDAATGA